MEKWWNERETDGGKLTITLFVIIWVANFSNYASLEGKNRKVIEVLSNCASLAKNEKGDGIEVKTGGGRLTIALSIFVWIASISN